MRRAIAPAATGTDGGRGGNAPIRELDRVRLTTSVVGDCDTRLPMGATGTVVGIYANGAAFEVEFSKPMDALATVEARSLLLVERAEP